MDHTTTRSDKGDAGGARQTGMNVQRPVSLNLNVRGMGLSATLAINERSRALQAEGRTIYRLGLGQSPFPVPDSIVEALRHYAPEKDYLPVQGLPALREAVAGFHRRHDDVEAHPDGVLIGPGSKELMFLAQLSFYGEIIVIAPCWVSYQPQARIIGRNVAVMSASRSNRWNITADQMRDAFDRVGDDERPRMLVLNYPNNPSGQTYTADELKEIAAVARQYNTIILSDEIYGQLHHQGKHVSIGRFYPEGTIISSGLSKWCGAGGWRLGTFWFPKALYWLRDAMAAVASETYTSVSAPIQYAAIHAFQGGVDIERYLWHARRILASLGRRCAEILTQAGIHVPAPEGGFYLFLDFSAHKEALAQRGITGGATLCERLLEETGVAILPGEAFAQSSSRLTARLAYVDFDGSRALAASEGIPLCDPLPADCARHWCEHTMRGVERIAEWVGGG